MRIVVDWALCDGNGMCVAEAPDVFDLDDDDTLVVLQETPQAQLAGQVDAAVRACPKRALSVER
jgi:ferredoxin